MIAFRNSYFAKSVNLAFMHVLFWSVAPSNVKVNGLKLIASFLKAGAD